jgi:hypothetical protein
MMKQLLWILTLCTLSSGCRLWHNACRTIILEPCHFPQYIDECVERHRHRRLATQVWNDLPCHDCVTRASDDYLRGFKDGFVDFMMAGGTGAPPPLAPHRYWKVRYQTPEGHGAIQDWFAGFAHGAAVAQSHGYRDFVTIPASMSFVHPIDPYLDLQQQGDPAGLVPDTPPPMDEVIPSPEPSDTPSLNGDVPRKPITAHPTLETSQAPSEGREEGGREEGVPRTPVDLLPRADGEPLTESGSSDQWPSSYPRQLGPQVR